MKNIIKLNVIFLVFFIIFSSQSIASDTILPLPKPTIDKETKEIIAKKKLIYPRKKPDEQKEEIITESTEKEEDVSEAKMIVKIKKTTLSLSRFFINF